VSSRLRHRADKTATHLILAVGALVVILPFLFMASTSLKSRTQVLEYPPRLLPTAPDLGNYVEVIRAEQFGVYFVNSLIVAVAATGLTLLVSTLLAYGFARFEFRWKEPVFYGLLLGMMIPPVMLIIPQFLVARNLGLLNSLLGLIVVYVTMNLALQTFLLRGFFEDIPRELEEAAVIDGAAPGTILWRIIIPLSRPGLAVVAIFTFLYSWDEFPWAHVAIQETSKRTLPIAIALFHGQYSTQWGLVFAASIIALLPVVVVFVFFQRYFIRGVSTSGIKG
jgi:multiple sugar transport system permease protein